MNETMRALILGAAVLGFLDQNGCSMWSINTEHKYHIVYADGKDEATLQGISFAVTDAANDWTAATGGFISFTEDNDPSLPTITIHKAIDIPNGGAADTTVYCDSANSDIYLPNNLSAVDTKQLALHEFGHALGLKHYVQNTVMYPFIQNESPHITCSDIDQLCFIWGCDPRSMPPCQNVNDE